jgi:hypothetical protein
MRTARSCQRGNQAKAVRDPVIDFGFGVGRRSEIGVRRRLQSNKSSSANNGLSFFYSRRWNISSAVLAPSVL